MSKELAAELAMEMVINDAISKGKLIDPSQIPAFVSSDVFVEAATRYTKMFLAEFK